jgi:hypothetical protein
MKAFGLSTRSALVILIFHSCNGDINSKNNTANEKASDEIAKHQTEMPGLADSAVGVADYKPEDQQPSSNKNPRDKTLKKEDWDKKIIKMANLNIEVKDYAIFTGQLHQKIKMVGGYISGEMQQETDYKIENTITIKVPVDQFDNAITELTASKEKIIEKKISAEDVTTEVIDTKSRIEAKKQVRLRYLDLLRQAKNMEEILQVENEINDIEGQLESAAGRMKYLNHATAFSTINLTYSQVFDAKMPGEKIPSYLHQVSEAFKEGLRWVANIIVALISIWPLWVASLLAWLVIKKIRTPKTNIFP